MRFLAYHLARLDELCDGPRKCSDAVDVTCKECNVRWTPADIRRPGSCPHCGSSSYVRERCGECLIPKIEAEMASPSGVLIRRAQAILFAISLPLVVTLEDVTCEQYSAMMTIKSEEARYQRQKERRK